MSTSRIEPSELKPKNEQKGKNSSKILDIRNTNVCTFEFLQQHIDLIKLPSSNWSFSRGNTLFFGFQKVEQNGTIRKRVAVVPEFEIKVFIDDNLIPFCEFIRVISIAEFGKLLKLVDVYHLI